MPVSRREFGMGEEVRRPRMLARTLKANWRDYDSDDKGPAQRPPGQVLLISSCVFHGRESVPGKAQKTTTYMFDCHCVGLYSYG